MCVTETHSPEAIDKLRATMEKFVRS